MQGKQLTCFTVALMSLIITTIVVAVRCVVRLSIKGFGLDDWSMAIGQLLMIGTCISVMWGCEQGIGVKDEYLTAEQLVNARHSVLIFQCFYLISLIFVKGSICFALLRITTNKWIRYFLWFINFLSFCCGFITTVACLSLCTPVSASWTGIGKCAAASVLKSVAYYTTVSSIITDFSCSILPYVILWNLQMDRKLKFTVAAVLSLGFFASAATVVRAFHFNRFLATKNYVWGFSDLMIWSVAEDLIAITIGSVPSLKPLISNMKWMGALSSHRSTRKIGGYEHCESYVLQSKDKSQMSTRIVTTQKAEDSESVREILEDDRIMVSSELRVQDEYLSTKRR